MAAAIGRNGDAKKYADLSDKVKEAFVKAFVDADGKVKGDTQTAYAEPLFMGMLSGEARTRATQHLVENIRKQNGHLSTGFIGTAYLLPALTDNGEVDTAHSLLLKTDYPSWGYMVGKGATTIWERWDSIMPDGKLQTPGMNSFNHFCFGSVGEWMYRYLAGIDTDPQAPGFKKVVIRPRPGSLPDARAAYDSPYGKIVSDWKNDASGFTLNVTLPPNTSGTVYLPASSGDKITESGKAAEKANNVRFLRTEDGSAIYAVGAGNYRFQVAK
jgi:alpha-L-rhamnosidase